jgi:hypothetical protein
LQVRAIESTDLQRRLTEFEKLLNNSPRHEVPSNGGGTASKISTDQNIS